MYCKIPECVGVHARAPTFLLTESSLGFRSSCRPPLTWEVLTENINGGVPLGVPNLLVPLFQGVGLNQCKKGGLEKEKATDLA